jgi:competence protein ComEC
MKRLSILLLLLCLFITGCNNTNPGTNILSTDSIDVPVTEPIVTPSFVVYFINVGKADAALEICDGKSMLIDGGDAEDSDLISSYLKKLDITYLDYIVATHAHQDHVGGLSDVLNTISVSKVYAPKTPFNSKEYKNFIKGVKKQNLIITTPAAGDIINLGSSTITFLAPINEFYADLNNTSIVLRIVYGDTSFLFMGDAGSEAEDDIIAAGYALESTVIKIGHHGAETSTSDVFLEKVKPVYAVISCGKDDSYPSKAVLNRLHDAYVKIYRTDKKGDIIAASNGTDVTFTTQKN